MNNILPYSRQFIDRDDINEVAKVLKSDYLTQGPKLEKFETNFKKKVQSKYCLAISSATAGLHLSCLSLGLKSGDYLWTVPNSFVASANCGLYCGAKIDFVDIDEFTFNINIALLKKKLVIAKKKNKIPKILVVVHLAGSPIEVFKIKRLAKKYNFKIIEDASHAIGASYNQIKVGSCTHSDITVFSFHPVKIITSAEGGMALTNDKDIADRILRLRTHGITNDKKKMKQRSEDEIWNYQQIDLGYNYRMNDIQAALGLSQVKRLDQYIERRHQIAKYYDAELKNLSLTTPWQSPTIYSSYHLYPILIKVSSDTKTQKQVYDELRENNIAKAT